jgi:putative pyruvate formate lyase activating enzyme
MSCAFCQNYDISQEHKGKDVSIDALADVYLRLQDMGAANINLVSASHFIPQVIESITSARGQGLALPVVYNSNGYENVESLKLLEGTVDIYLPDIKYYSDRYAVKYSRAPHYFAHASAAVLEMERQVGAPSFEGEAMKRGLIIRHLLLPGLLSESKKILDWIRANLPEHVYVSIMSQYVPMYRASEYPEINRRVAAKNYEWLLDYFSSIGLKNGFMQDMECADSSYTPAFDLEGI